MIMSGFKWCLVYVWSVCFRTLQEEEVVLSGPVTEYQIFVRTGNRIGASGKADAKIILYGDKGCSKEFVLKESKRNKIKFQKGKVSYICVFTVIYGKR